MINVRSLEMWETSISMLWGKSPKIKYICGKCGAYNKTRISLKSMINNKPYVICENCGEINNTKLKLC